MQPFPPTKLQAAAKPTPYGVGQFDIKFSWLSTQIIFKLSVGRLGGVRKRVWRAMAVREWLLVMERVEIEIRNFLRSPGLCGLWGNPSPGSSAIPKPGGPGNLEARESLRKPSRSTSVLFSAFLSFYARFARKKDQTDFEYFLSGWECFG